MQSLSRTTQGRAQAARPSQQKRGACLVVRAAQQPQEPQKQPKRR